jgi:pimeloyl-ACP methyl ester carboxylesterase
LERQPITFVLVHGGFSGGFAWTKVANLLRRSGHDVFTPSLTGLGERRHLLSKDISLSTHVEDIRSLIELYDLWGVVLVGHSISGPVITWVADLVPRRLRRLVYVDAVVVRDRMRIRETIDETRWERRMADIRDSACPDGIPPERVTTTPGADEAFRQWVDERLSPHPLGVYFEPMRLANPNLGNGVPKVYVDCDNPSYPIVEEHKRIVREDGTFEMVRFAADHYPHVTKPEEFTRLLLKLAKPPAGATAR